NEMTEVVGEVGSQVMLPCMCEAAQCDPATITWSKESKGTVWRKQSSGLQYWGSNWFNRENSRVQCPHSKFGKGDYSLEINGLTKDDAGLYTCKVEIKGHLTDKWIMLRVIEASVSPSTPMWGDNVSLRCSVTPWPENAVVYWMLNRQPSTSKTGRVVEVQETGRVVEVQASDELAGTWTCFVHKSSNIWKASVELSVAGKSLTAERVSNFQQPFSFFVLLGQIHRNPGGRTEPDDAARPLHFLTISKKKGTTMLSCQLSDPSEVTSYEWVHVSYDINGTELVEPVQYGQTVPVKEDFGEWTCRYFGTNGLLGNVTTQVHLMAGLSGEKSSGVSSNTGTVIGLSFLLVILLLILAQMYKNHRRRRRILQYPALETIVHTISNEREEREKDRVKK
uniref:Lymphocyte activation gene 3 protein-like n=1 Tax=Poecilia latipinna TaxID=48699 RepID=A0A3B3TUQ7_9TELE